MLTRLESSFFNFQLLPHMKKYIVILLFALVNAGVSAQTLNEQFTTLRDDAETFKVYKVIKQSELNDFWASVQDTIKNKDSRISAYKSQVENLESTQSTLKTTIEEKDAIVKEKEYAGSHISFMGIDFEKDSYIMLNVVIIALLIISIAVLVYKFKDNNKTARKKSSDYDRLDTEFENYKRNALEKQMKLRRDLQTARNRLEEIRST